ncbi:hypothetical protein Leryth_002247 [Lithospermum erythrorhizon]|nr:hypothetical protein Leryth_002247 [Lithospermum erythrorhizon]
MNFLGLRSSQTAVPEKPPQPPPPPQPSNVHQSQIETIQRTGSATLECLIAEDPIIRSSEDSVGGDHDDGGYGIGSESFESSGGISKARNGDTHVDVSDDEGWITIPYKELPENWKEVPEIASIRSLDRTFVFPGEQVHILACLSACKQDIEIITPFKVAAAMNKNGIRRSTEKQNGSTEKEVNSAVDGVSDGKDISQSNNSGNHDSSGESLLRMEDHRRQTERLLQRFIKSHFFVRIADSNEALWSKRSSEPSAYRGSSLNTVVDRGSFDSSSSGGIARDAVQCHALPNGDIVVLLQINVGVDVLRDPVLEVLQFEKYRERGLASKSYENLAPSYQDPCGELLKWLIPMDNSMSSPSRTVSPPPMSGPSLRSPSTKSNFSASSGSQIFSFSNFRSYSMSSLSSNNTLTSTVKPHSSRASSDPDEWAHFSYQKSLKSEKSDNEELLSFRGVPLEPERFSVSCGLEGISVPGKRWRRKIEIIQPVEINSFAADCNTDDLLCVQIKNIAPAHASNILVYVDAITIISEDPSSGGMPTSFPIACIEVGNEHSLPNLALRRGEEHSFILKPAVSLWKHKKGRVEVSPQLSPFQSHSSSNEVRHSGSSEDQYTVLVSCRCNYTESKLFFKQPTSWRPRISRDLLISVASETSKQTLGTNGKVAQLPVQVMTLQASNLTSEDLTLTVLAPASFTSPPSMVSLSSSPMSPLSPLAGSSEFSEQGSDERHSIDMPKSHSTPANKGQGGEGGSRPVLFNEQTIPISEVLPSGDFGCTHLWLQSKVPLGCIPSQSMASIKLEVLPLTDGIITLDSLQIDVKERGVTYVPEHSLKINAKSSISAEII